jgi:hypothetical protein
MHRGKRASGSTVAVRGQVTVRQSLRAHQRRQHVSHVLVMKLGNTTRNTVSATVTFCYLPTSGNETTLYMRTKMTPKKNDTLLLLTVIITAVSIMSTP